MRAVFPHTAIQLVVYGLIETEVSLAQTVETRYSQSIHSASDEYVVNAGDLGDDASEADGAGDYVSWRLDLCKSSSDSVEST